MASVLALVLSALPWSSHRGREVIVAIVGRGGGWGRITADAVALRVGLRSRQALSRLLQAEGLPSFRELEGWIRVLRIVAAHEAEGASLARSALTHGADPAAGYRAVQRITGLPWPEVKRRGSAWVLGELLARCPTRRAVVDGQEMVG